MNGLILDAGALIAVDRGDRAVHARLEIALEVGADVRTHAMVVAQVWRNAKGRQARLAKLLGTIDVVPVDKRLGRAAGELCGSTATDDPIDAGVALIAEPGDVVLTSDPDQLRALIRAAGVPAAVVRV